MRDEYRNDYDEGRGGWGARIREEEEREANTRDVYDGTNAVPTGSFDNNHQSSSYYQYSGGKRDRDDDDDEKNDAYGKRKYH